MPLPAAVIPAISAGSSLAGGVINAFQTQGQNRKSRDWSEYMYERQRLDNLSHWNQQNEYNTPANQMARMKAAGLNPAMMYGGGQGGGTASPVQKAEAQRPEFKVPRAGDSLAQAGTTFMNSIYNMELKEQQLDNLKADNTVKLAQAALLASQGDRSQFDLGLETELKAVSAEARKEQLRKLQIDNKFQLSENERRQVQTSANLAEAAERVLNYRVSRTKDEEETKRITQAIKNLKSDKSLKDLDIELRKMGINPTDTMFSRILGRLLNKLINDPKFRRSPLGKIINP